MTSSVTSRSMPIAIALCTLMLLPYGCTSFEPWPTEVVGKRIPPIVTDQTITLPREEMVFRKVAPSQYGRRQPDFFMLETEVTNEMYSKYLRATGKMKNDYSVYDKHIADLVRETRKDLTEDRRYGNYPHYGTTGPLDASIGDFMNRMTLWDGQRPRVGQGALPVTLVTAHDAEDFCSWLTSQYPDLGTFRLPTDQEWVFAAYGKERKYPWGDEWQDDAFHHTHRPPPPAKSNRTDRFSWGSFEEMSPEPVRWRPQGCTPEGLWGMWGNAEEMVIHPSNLVSVTFLCVGTRWMGGSFEDSNRSSTSSDPEWTPFQPRQDYWGFSHSDQVREQSLGFRALLDPTDKEHKFQPRAPYNFDASW